MSQFKLWHIALMKVLHDTWSGHTSFFSLWNFLLFPSDLEFSPAWSYQAISKQSNKTWNSKISIMGISLWYHKTFFVFLCMKSWIYNHSSDDKASLMGQMVKNLPEMYETRVRSLGLEESLEKEVSTYSSIFAWRIPWTEKPGGLQSMGHKESDITEWLTFSLSLWW